MTRSMILAALCVIVAMTAAVASADEASDAWMGELRAARSKDPARDAHGAVDGIIDGGFAFHTNEERNPWWQVDLGSVQHLDRVQLWNRVGLWERAKTVTVRLSLDGNRWREVYRHDGSMFKGYKSGGPLVVKLDGAEARFLRLQLRERTMFHLDEVQVYATAAPDENIALNRPAMQSSTSQWSSFAPLPRDHPVGDTAEDLRHARRIIDRLLDRIGPASDDLRGRMHGLLGSALPAAAPEWSALYAEASSRAARLTKARAAMQYFDAEALRLAIDDLEATFGADYPDAEIYRRELNDIALNVEVIAERLEAGQLEACTDVERLISLQRRALMANPLLDFEELLFVRRSDRSPRLGLPQNWQGNCSLPRRGYDNAICILADLRDEPSVATLYRPERDVFVGDVDLHFDGDRLLFSSVNDSNIWQVFEVGIDGSNVKQVTAGPISAMDNYDACYLPDDRIIFASAAVCQGVPCVSGNDAVSNLYLADPDFENVRQLCFDQDHNWNPTVMLDGSVLFTRWEYTDTAHYFTRLLFRMNPDGTGQSAVYGSNSFWPNSMFYTRPIPGEPSKFATIVSGHHGVARMGELVLLDVARGTHEADGVIQRIPGRGRPVEPVIVDQLVDASWPKFLHPWPLSDKYFLAACKPSPSSNWGLYLVDVFDNMVLIHEEPGQALLEPVPVARRERPPVIPDRVRPEQTQATIYLSDIYHGPGLDGVPRGSVAALRIFEWHYGYNKIGGHQHVALEGGWDVKRILGTVPVEEDGSALFTVPANTPLAVQPINEKGESLQLMRSWFTAMPGEILSCVGCHERPNDSVPNRRTLATMRPPAEIEPWFGPTRGFSFKREVQPVLDRRCVACHDGSTREDGRRIPNFADSAKGWGGFTNSYRSLQAFVRRPGPESDYHMLPPAEFRVNTSELVQMLRKGHHNVELTEEEWDRLITWIDMNVPDHGSWTEYRDLASYQESYELRRKYRKLFANIVDDPEARVPVATERIEPIMPDPVEERSFEPVDIEGWPLTPALAAQLQQAAAPVTRRTIELEDAVSMEFVLIPAGRFVMGGDGGDADELPAAVVSIDQPFWMSTTEVTNEQYRCFDARHDSRYYDQRWKDHTTPGYPANLPNQPVIRVNWNEVSAFCDWLSARTGEAFRLPTEAEWEYAARAGSATPFSFGDLDTDFAPHANMADASTSRLVVTGVNPRPVANPDPEADYLPKDSRFDDGHTLVADVGSFKPNAWGLHDMHGNVAEWTSSYYAPYPFDESLAGGHERVVRGGSWRDRPMRCRSAFRLHYPEWQGVFNVGFRIVCPADDVAVTSAHGTAGDG
jgi:formylglycine-generating enzyme required for sulfatase activity